MANSVVNVDSSWLSTNGPAPYHLNTDNTTYVLQTDVSVTDANLYGDIFVIGARNVFLNLNGHFIYLNGSDYPQKTDGHIYDVAGHPIRLESPTGRCDPSADVQLFGGTYFDGNDAQQLIDPSSPEYPPIVEWADTK